MGASTAMRRDDYSNWAGLEASTDTLPRAFLPDSTGYESIPYVMDMPGWMESEQDTGSIHKFDRATTHVASFPSFRLDVRILANMDDEAVISKMGEEGFVHIANRLKYLYDVTEEDEEAIKLGSLRNFAKFIMINRNLISPQITVTVNGLIQAVWRQPQGTLVMNFQESGDIAFTLLFGKGGQGTRRRKLIGELPPDQVMQHVGGFMSGLMGV